MVKNPPANPGDVGLIPYLERSHIPQSNYTHTTQLVSLYSRAGELQLLSPQATAIESCVP